MPEIAYTTSKLAKMFPQVEGHIRNVRNWSPVIRYSTRVLPAAAIGPTNFFDTGPLVGSDNLERAREVPYKSIFFGIAIQVLIGTIADAAVLFEEGEITLTVDESNLPVLPVAAIPGGGGINAAISTTVAAITESVSLGLDNRWFSFFEPVVIEQTQNFNVSLRSSAITALVAANTRVRISLEGIEARRTI